MTEQQEMPSSTTEVQYDYKQVLRYLKLFRHVADVSNGLMKHVKPTEQTEESISLSPPIPEEKKKLYPAPTPLTMKVRRQQGTYSPALVPELYILIMENSVEIREHNGFMFELSKFVQRQPPLYQKRFGEHLDAYTKHRLFKVLPEEEYWRVIKASVMYTEIEDYLRAFIAVQMIYQEED